MVYEIHYREFFPGSRFIPPEVELPADAIVVAVEHQYEAYVAAPPSFKISEEGWLITYLVPKK